MEKIHYFQTYDFTSEDLIDQGEIGRGAYGTVNQMYHEQSNTVMAVKVRSDEILLACFCWVLV